MATGATSDIMKGKPASQVVANQAGNAATVAANPLGMANHPTAAQGTATALTGAGLGAKGAQDAVDINKARKDPNKSAPAEAAGKIPGQAAAASGLGVAGVGSNAAALRGNTAAAQGQGIGGGAGALVGNAADQALANRPKPKPSGNDIEMQRRSLFSRQVANDRAMLMDILVRRAEKQAAANFLRRRAVYYADEL